MKKDIKNKNILTKKDRFELFLIFLCIPILILGFSVSLSVYSTKKSGKTSSVLGYSFFTVVSKSMEPELKVGDSFVCKKIAARDVEIGDIISFKKNKAVITHKVAEIYHVQKEGETVILFQTYGINNKKSNGEYIQDNYLVSENELLGIYVESPPLNSFVGFLLSSWGMFCFVIIPIGFIILSDTLSLISYIKPKETKQLAAGLAALENAGGNGNASGNENAGGNGSVGGNGNASGNGSVGGNGNASGNGSVGGNENIGGNENVNGPEISNVIFSNNIEVENYETLFEPYVKRHTEFEPNIKHTEVTPMKKDKAVEFEPYRKFITYQAATTHTSKAEFEPYAKKFITFETKVQAEIDPLQKIPSELEGKNFKAYVKKFLIFEIIDEETEPLPENMDLENMNFESILGSDINSGISSESIMDSSINSGMNLESVMDSENTADFECINDLPFSSVQNKYAGVFFPNTTQNQATEKNQKQPAIDKSPAIKQHAVFKKAEAVERQTFAGQQSSSDRLPRTRQIVASYGTSSAQNNAVSTDEEYKKSKPTKSTQPDGASAAQSNRIFGTQNSKANDVRNGVTIKKISSNKLVFEDNFLDPFTGGKKTKLPESFLKQMMENSKNNLAKNESAKTKKTATETQKNEEKPFGSDSEFKRTEFRTIFGTANAETKTSERLFDPTSNQYTETSDKNAKRLFDPISNQYVIASDESKIVYDPQTDRYVYASDKSKIAFDPFTNKYIYSDQTEKPEFDPFTNNYTTSKSKPVPADPTEQTKKLLTIKRKPEKSKKSKRDW